MHTNTKKIVYCLVQHVWSWCKSFFFTKKNKSKDWTSKTLPNPPPPTSINISILA